jgi:hypothetical protein
MRSKSSQNNVQSNDHNGVNQVITMRMIWNFPKSIAGTKFQQTSKSAGHAGHLNIPLKKMEFTAEAMGRKLNQVEPCEMRRFIAFRIFHYNFLAIRGFTWIHHDSALQTAQRFHILSETRHSHLPGVQLFSQRGPTYSKAWRSESDAPIFPSIFALLNLPTLSHLFSKHVACTCGL